MFCTQSKIAYNRHTVFFVKCEKPRVCTVIIEKFLEIFEQHPLKNSKLWKFGFVLHLSNKEL